MKLSQICSWTFIVSLFLWVAVWAFWPAASAQLWPHVLFPVVSVLGIIGWVVFSWGHLKAWLGRRSTQFGLGMLLMALMSIVLLSFVNWLAVRKNVKKDFTATSLHTLSEQTKNLLAKLPEEVEITVWSTSLDRMAPNLDMQGFLDNYEQAGGDKVRIQVRNPQEFFTEAQQAKLQRDHVIVVTALTSGRTSRVETFSDSKGEEQLTNAIVQATKGRKKQVCFVSGHGEASTANSDAMGLSLLKESMEQGSYQTQDIVLASAETVPPECELLALVGPRNAPVERELQMLQTYLQAGGPLIALVGPEASAPWRDLLGDYGVKVRQDLVVDPLQGNNPTMVVTRNYASNVELVEDFQLVTVFPKVASLQVPSDDAEQAASGAQVRAFAFTEGQTYAKQGDLKNIRSLARGPGDRRGPLPLAALIQKKLGPPPAEPPAGEANPEENQAPPVKEWRAVLFSNDGFVRNSFIGGGGNKDLFMNSVSFLLQNEDLIGIQPRDIRQTYLELQAQDIRKVVGVIFLLAGFFLVGGIRAARRRSVVV